MKRLECLDGLRGALAVYVLLGHMAPFAVLPDWLQSLVSHGGAAVDVFFILSGLVIAQSLGRSSGNAKVFLIGRAARIFPVYLPIFAVSVIVQPWSCGFGDMSWIGPGNAARTICVMAWPHAWLPEIAAHLTMTHGLFPNAVLKDVWVSFLGAAWSLSTEWQFYILALAMTRISLSGSRLAEVLLGLAAAGVVWHLTAPEAWQFSRAFLPNKAHFFALGVASGPLVRGVPGALVRYTLVLTAAIALCATQQTAGKILPPLVWTLCLAAQIHPRAPLLRHPYAWLGTRPMQWLGAISYCVYLVNEPIHKVLGGALSQVADGDSLLFSILWLPLAVLLPIGAAAWLHVWLEIPALRLGRSLAVGTSRPEPTGQTGGWPKIPADLPGAGGPIILAPGWHDDATGRGSGLLHIEARHGAEIRAAGYADTTRFVLDIARGFTEVFGQSGDRLFLVRRDPVRTRPADPHDVLIVSQAATGWHVETAGRFKASYIDKREKLWQAVHTAAPQPSEPAVPSSTPPTRKFASAGRSSARDQS
jgi:peptidoglycan/LPS O-acetylase OafA/YrhL